MTNREWLESLSDEEFAETVENKIRGITWLWKGEVYEKYIVRFEFRKWLKAEHKEKED